ncbi:hypothetical protein GALMADRAFT_142224 [Galerina marginata CBS 339.88]|uniref:Uncharacterized protein n=1 Tax=Galerina marginata (strain CBS 339.88) TaxID=685588 RepID=A0A067SSC0_GALM3|nr:hypothetical protein GALMADRAFT_142224 [Galerina marginata CBS 339.88]
MSYPPLVKIAMPKPSWHQTFDYKTPYPHFPPEGHSSSMIQSTTPPNNLSATFDSSPDDLQLDCDTLSTPYHPYQVPATTTLLTTTTTPISQSTSPPYPCYSLSSNEQELNYFNPPLYYPTDGIPFDSGIFMTTDPDPELWSAITSTDQTTVVPSSAGPYFPSSSATPSAPTRDMEIQCGEPPHPSHPPGQVTSGSGILSGSRLAEERHGTPRPRLPVKPVSSSGTDPYYKPLPRTMPFVDSTVAEGNTTHSGNTSTHSKGKAKPRQRQPWPNAFENVIFSQREVSTLPPKHRRAAYVASLEAQIERLHGQFSDLGLWPVPVEKLKLYDGVSSAQLKSMIACMFHDMSSLEEKVHVQESKVRQLFREIQDALPDVPTWMLPDSLRNFYTEPPSSLSYTP